MQFYRLIDGSTPNIHEIRQQNPDVGIPDYPEDLSEFGYEPFKHVDAPTHSAEQVAWVSGYAKKAGVWSPTWEVRAMNAAELAEYKAKIKLALDEYMSEFRAMRIDLLNVLTGIAMAEGMLTEFRVLRQQLLDIPQAPNVVKATTAAQAKAAIKVEYARIVKGVPLSFIIAFKEID